MDGLYMSIEIGDQCVKHTHWLADKDEELTREQIDEEIERFIKKCHALLEFSKVLKEVE